MSLFDWLLVSHLVGDFLIQTRNMAMHKAESWPWMLRHVGVYMVLITVVVVWYSVAYQAPAWLAVVVLLFIAGTHIILDRRTFTKRWLDYFVRVPDHPWMPIVVDQVFHIVALAIVAQALVLASG